MIEKRWLIQCVFFSMLLLFIHPVFANPANPTMTKIVITQNGIPLSDPVNFSLDCYGTVQGPLIELSRHGARDLQNSDNIVVYSYSATCRPAETCYVYKPDTPWMVNISHCNLSGMYKGQHFFFKNYSVAPMLSSWLTISHFGDKRETYALTQKAHNQCYDQRTKNVRACDRFVIKDSPDIVNESGIFPTGHGPDYWRCKDNATQEIFSCLRNNGIKLNETEAIDSNLYSELQFDIASDNKIIQKSAINAQSPVISRSPVETIYCNFLSFFGRSC